MPDPNFVQLRGEVLGDVVGSERILSDFVDDIEGSKVTQNSR